MDYLHKKTLFLYTQRFMHKYISSVLPHPNRSSLLYTLMDIRIEEAMTRSNVPLIPNSSPRPPLQVQQSHVQG